VAKKVEQRVDSLLNTNSLNKLNKLNNTSIE
jgi:hypothetical protein